MRSGGAGSGTSDPRIGKNPPLSARWGDCAKDWPRENVVSPYPFKTAADHYAALLADAKSRGGPTKYTFETMPRWDGVYGEYLPEGRRVWNYGRAMQVPTFLSLLQPEYQQRMVRQLYHEGVDAAHQWSASYCWPEGFMRQWATGPKPQRIVMNPDVVVFLGSGSGNIVRTAHIGRTFDTMGQQIPQWYGDTIAFWDGDALIMHTANVQAWTQHTTWEFSYKFEAIEILTPAKDASGKFVGLDWETVIYDPEALAAAGAHPLASQLRGRLEHGRSARLGGVHARALSDRRIRDAGRARRGDRVRGPGYVRPPVGAASGKRTSNRTWIGPRKSSTWASSSIFRPVEPARRRRGHEGNRNVGQDRFERARA